MSSSRITLHGKNSNRVIVLWAQEEMANYSLPCSNVCSYHVETKFRCTHLVRVLIVSTGITYREKCRCSHEWTCCIPEIMWSSPSVGSYYGFEKLQFIHLMMFLRYYRSGKDVIQFGSITLLNFSMDSLIQFLVVPWYLSRPTHLFTTLRQVT